MRNFSDILSGLQGNSGPKHKKIVLTKSEIKNIFGAENTSYYREGSIVVNLKWSEDKETAEISVTRVPE